jgi:uncharacterized repeat protein (TIGR03803 family)
MIRAIPAHKEEQMAHVLKSRPIGKSCAGFVAAVALALSLSALGPIAQAQTFTVIHTFSGMPDGGNSTAGLTFDQAGNLYCTTGSGGDHNKGSVFRLVRHSSGWIMTPLYSFQGGDGLKPAGRVTFGPDGTLYGTTSLGQGDGCSCGNVFNLKPPPSRPTSVLAPWIETVIHQFSPTQGEGVDPSGDVVFDRAGNLYGTTQTGGMWEHCSGGVGCGTVYQLTRSGSGWTENVIWALSGQYDGEYPIDGPAIDANGNLYVTSSQGYYENNFGAVFELSLSNGSWAESTLHNFPNGAADVPFAGVVLDPAGNLYGATSYSPGGGGSVYELSPATGLWNFQTLSYLSGNGSGRSGPFARLLRDAAGNLYGTTDADGAYGKGSVFKLTPGSGGWTFTTLYDFTGGSDGANPQGALVMDSSGNLYGTTFQGGGFSANCYNYQCGVVFEITP